MGKKGKQKGRRKDRRDHDRPAEAGTEAAVRERGGRIHPAPELWFGDAGPLGRAGDGDAVLRDQPDVVPGATRGTDLGVARAEGARVGRKRARAGGAHGRPASDAAELAARLASLSTVLQRQLGRVEAGEGLTRARLSALALLVLGGPRRLGELAAAERVRPPTMTRLVHAMEADGLVAREPDPSDRRSIVIRATPTGEAQLEAGRARQLAPLAESIDALDAAEQETLAGAAELLERLLRETGRASGYASG
jgi:DNA-binding MarR family transcriptional regulator